MKNKIEDRSITVNSTILQALKRMDVIDRKLLLVFDQGKFVNVLSIGDIQRGILKNIPVENEVSAILRKNTRIASENDSFSSIKDSMRKFRMECLPVVNKNNELIEVHFWEDVFGVEDKRNQASLDLPVVIMAGGKGTRLKPLTNIIPKPLIPIGDKTIIEEIMDRFVNFGCSEFHLSVNYKAETLKHYLKELNNSSYQLSYFQEDMPLGTAGSLFLIKDKINTTFFVSNCDIIIDEDYGEILNYHRQGNNELTIVSALKHYPIPYGTIEIEEGGILKELKEKPELTFQINTGFYILEPHLLNEVPENQFFHITHLIEKIQHRGGKVGVFPVSEGSWKDIGDSSYLKTLLV